MSAPARDGLLGRIAVHYQIVTQEQLAEAIRAQGRIGNQKKLGEILLELGFINQKQLDWLLAAQQKLQAQQQETLQKSQQEAQAAHTKNTDGGRVITVAQQPERAIDFILRQAVKLHASDVHIHAGTAIQMRVHGRLLAANAPVVPQKDAERHILEILDAEQQALLKARGELDLAYSLAGVARFRANVYRQQRGLDAVFRPIPLEPPGLESLGLPRTLARLTTYHQGLVLITGPSGCGKSSTLAALVNLINEERRDHIITVEDPIEYLHPSKRCIVNQRQVVRHTESFASALRAALREDPDVIAIGELRDLETVSLAITAAETGHLVLATLHTNNAVRTINRVLDVFPPKQQAQIRAMVSESLRAIVSQRLVPSVDGSRRLPALETLFVTPAISNMIREEKTFQIRSIMQTGREQGMGLLDDSLLDLVKKGLISKEIARKHGEDTKLFA
jgi:twitching motility protein PilT